MLGYMPQTAKGQGAKSDCQRVSGPGVAYLLTLTPPCGRALGAQVLTVNIASCMSSFLGLKHAAEHTVVMELNSLRLAGCGVAAGTTGLWSVGYSG